MSVYVRKHLILLTCLIVTVLIHRSTGQTAQQEATSSIAPDPQPPTPPPPIFDIAINIAPLHCPSLVSNCYAAAGEQLSISSLISDQTYNDSTTQFEWSNKDGPIKQDIHTRNFHYTFQKPDDSQFIQVKATHPKTNASGTKKSDLAVKSPVVVLDPDGKLFLEFGELLNVNLRFTGSPPFHYCYRICSPYDILPCVCFLPHSETNDQVVSIVHYLHYVGNYTLMFDILNDINHETKYYAIKINDTVRKSTLPIAPIVSSILAVCILIIGVALHLHFRETSYTTEIANFDFVRDYEEDWEEELSFIQRVKYILCHGDDGREDDDDDGESRLLLNRTSNGTITR